MSYVIFGRPVKNAYISLGVLTTTFGGAFLATRGGNKAQAKPTTVQAAKDSVPVNASSSEEEKFIQEFIKQAEAEGAGASSGH